MDTAGDRFRSWQVAARSESSSFEGVPRRLLGLFFATVPKFVEPPKFADCNNRYDYSYRTFETASTVYTVASSVSSKVRVNSIDW